MERNVLPLHWQHRFRTILHFFVGMSWLTWNWDAAGHRESVMKDRRLKMKGTMRTCRGKKQSIILTCSKKFVF